MVNQTPRGDPDPWTVVKQLHRVWKEIDTHVRKLNPAKEKSELLSLALHHCYERSKEQVESFDDLVRSGQAIANNVRTIRDNLILDLCHQSACAVQGEDEEATSYGESPSTTEAARIIGERWSSATEVGDEVGNGESTSATEAVRIICERPISATEINDEVGNGDGPSTSLHDNDPLPSELDVVCKFHPTEQELIACLRNKFLGKAVPKVIRDHDLYGNDEPKDLFGGNEEKEELYFFTRIKPKFDTGTRKDRVAGGGNWKLQKESKIYEDSKAMTKVIGHKRTLNFITKPKSDSWIMHEFTLPEADQHVAVWRVKRGRGNTWGHPPATAAAAELQPATTSSCAPNR